MRVSNDCRCLIHGLVLASEVELPLPQVEFKSADVTYTVALNKKFAVPSHSRSDDSDHPWAIEHWIGTRLAVEFPGWATFELSRTAVTLVADKTGDQDLVIHLLLDHVLPRVISLRGDLMLHAAGAVGPSGRAHLFVGATGAGKSTIVTFLVSKGWLLLDDDGIRLSHTALGFRALPGAAAVRLLPDASDALVPDFPAGRPMYEGSKKRRFAADGRRLRVATGPTPIEGLYLLIRNDESEPSVQRLGFADALTTITEHGFHLADEPTSITRQAFERASALAAETKLSRLVYPTDLDNLDATFALLAVIDRRAFTPSS